MSNLLKSDFYKLFKMKSFYVCCIISALLASVTMFLNFASNNMIEELMGDMMASQIMTLKNVLPSLISPTGDWFILVIIGVSLFITIEYNAGTLKNIVARGFKREYIFLSKLIVCVIETFIISLCYAVFGVIFGLILLGTPAGGFGDGYFLELLAIYGVDILIIIGYVALITMVAYLIRTNGGTISLTLCAHYLVPVVITMLNVTNIMNDETDLETMVSYTTNPYGNAAYYWIGTLGGTVSESYHNGTIYIPILIALAYVAVSCFIGLLVFKKRDVK